MRVLYGLEIPNIPPQKNTLDWAMSFIIKDLIGSPRKIIKENFAPYIKKEMSFEKTDCITTHIYYDTEGNPILCEFDYPILLESVPAEAIERIEEFIMQNTRLKLNKPRKIEGIYFIPGQRELYKINLQYFQEELYPE